MSAFCSGQGLLDKALAPPRLASPSDGDGPSADGPALGSPMSPPWSVHGLLGPPWWLHPMCTSSHAGPPLLSVCNVPGLSYEGTWGAVRPLPMVQDGAPNRQLHPMHKALFPRTRSRSHVPE